MDGCHFLTSFAHSSSTSGRNVAVTCHTQKCHSLNHSHSSSSSSTSWTCKAKNPIKRREEKRITVSRKRREAKGKRKERRINHSYFVTVILREKCSRAMLILYWWWFDIEKWKLIHYWLFTSHSYTYSCTFLELLNVYVNSICHLHHCRSSSSMKLIS